MTPPAAAPTCPSAGQRRSSPPTKTLLVPELPSLWFRSVIITIIMFHVMMNRKREHNFVIVSSIRESEIFVITAVSSSSFKETLNITKNILDCVLNIPRFYRTLFHYSSGKDPRSFPRSICALSASFSWDLNAQWSSHLLQWWPFDTNLIRNGDCLTLIIVTDVTRSFVTVSRVSQEWCNETVTSLLRPEPGQRGNSFAWKINKKGHYSHPWSF